MGYFGLYLERGTKAWDSVLIVDPPKLFVTTASSREIMQLLLPHTTHQDIGSTSINKKILSHRAI